MAKSRKRGGTKTHNKRVESRNNIIKSEKRRSDKVRKDIWEKMMKDYEAQLAANEAQNDNVDTIVPDIDQIEGLDAPEL